MKVYKEVSGDDFDFWAGAKDRVKYLKTDEVEQIFQCWKKLTLAG